MNGGIYSIINTQNNKCYIGSTKNFKRRWQIHKATLKGNNHDNPRLQNAWNLYKESTFEFRILANIQIEELLIETEQRFIDELNPEYNLNKVAGKPPVMQGNQFRLGKIHSSKTKEKMRKSHIGKVFSEEHKRKIGLACKGKTASNKPGPKSSNWKGGHSDYYKRKMRLAAN